MMLVKVASVGLLSIFLAACGIVDTEQAQEAIDLKTQVLEIKTTQIDPLMEEIDTLSPVSYTHLTLPPIYTV